MVRRFNFCYFLVLTVFVSPFVAAQQQPEKLTLAQFEEKLRNAVEPQILDVRSPQEYAENHLQGAVNFYVPDDESFERSVASLRRDRPVFVYSINNGRSSTVSSKLIAAGFKEVYPLPGGLAHWIGAGHPIISLASNTPGLSRPEFDKLVAAHDVVLVEVGSRHCGGCKKLAPIVEEVSHQQGVKVINIELYDNRDLARSLNIESVPTLILYKRNDSIWRKSGAITKNEIVDALENSL